MKRANYFFGIAILAVAVTLALIILFTPRERGGTGWTTPGGGAGFGEEQELDWSRATATRAKLERHTPELGRVEPGAGAPPMLIAQARQVEALAMRRLRVLSDQLSLTREQQAEIFPLLARSSSAFDEALTVVDETGSRTGGRLDRRAAEEGIHDLLDPAQQEELIESIAEKDLWWADVIVRLERDLRRSTDPVDEPLPAREPEATDLAPAPHRGRNLFELPHGEDQ